MRTGLDFSLDCIWKKWRFLDSYNIREIVCTYFQLFHLLFDIEIHFQEIHSCCPSANQYNQNKYTFQFNSSLTLVSSVVYFQKSNGLFNKAGIEDGMEPLIENKWIWTFILKTDFPQIFWRPAWLGSYLPGLARAIATNRPKNIGLISYCFQNLNCWIWEKTRNLL